MKFRKSLESDIGGSTRCGRCATILPDETMSYCPACGALFSQVPPTNSYVDFAQHRLEKRFQRNRFKFTFIAFLLLFGFFASFGLLNVALDQIHIANTLTGYREVRFHFFDLEGLPALPAPQKREALAIGLQAFEDHFHAPLSSVSIRENSLPSALVEPFAQAQRMIRDGKLDPLSLPISRMSFWEKKVFPAMVRRWQNDPDQTLDVIVTNLPIRADPEISAEIETRHLGGAGLVSGLANPGLVLVSTFRVHNDHPDLVLDRPPTQTEREKARFVGEFIVAHELGHALLGLGDIILRPEDYERDRTTDPQDTVMRSPASIGRRGTAAAGADYRNCLMHTDGGGGFLAWDYMRKRTTGESSNCHAYDGVVEAFKLRFEAWKMLKAGMRDEAETMHAKAIALASEPNVGWVARSWQREHYLFASFYKRWWLGMFMFQSRHDQFRIE